MPNLSSQAGSMNGVSTNSPRRVGTVSEASRPQRCAHAGKNLFLAHGYQRLLCCRLPVGMQGDGRRHRKVIMARKPLNRHKVCSYETVLPVILLVSTPRDQQVFTYA
jgi:hypothetical protein